MNHNMQQQAASYYHQGQQVPPPWPLQHPYNQPQQSHERHSQQGNYHQLRQSELQQGTYYHLPQNFGPQIQQSSQHDRSTAYDTYSTGLQHPPSSYPRGASIVKTPPVYSGTPHATCATNAPASMHPSNLGVQPRVPLNELHATNRRQYDGAGRKVLHPSGPSHGGQLTSGLPMAPSKTVVPDTASFYHDENVLHASENTNKRLKTSNTGFSHVPSQANVQPLTAPAASSAHAGIEPADTTGRRRKRKADGTPLAANGAANTPTTVPAIVKPPSGASSATTATTQTQTRQPAPLRPLSSALHGLPYLKTASSYLSMAAALAKLNEPQWSAPKLPLEAELRDSLVNQYERCIYNSMTDFRGFYDKVEQPDGDMPRDGTPHIYDHRLIDRGSLNEDDLHLAAYNIMDKLIKLHTVGTSCRGASDPTNLKGNESERNWGFHTRLSLICEALTKFKSLVLQCIDEPGNIEHLVVLAPNYALESRVASMKNNDVKAAKTRATAAEKVLSAKQIAQAMKRKDKAKKEKLAKATEPAAGPDTRILESQDPRQQSVLKAASHQLGLKKTPYHPFFNYVTADGRIETPSISSNDNEDAAIAKSADAQDGVVDGEQQALPGSNQNGIDTPEALSDQHLLSAVDPDWTLHGANLDGNGASSYDDLFEMNNYGFTPNHDWDHVFVPSPSRVRPLVDEEAMSGLSHQVFNAKPSVDPAFSQDFDKLFGSTAVEGDDIYAHHA